MTGEPSGRLVSILTRSLAPQTNEIENRKKNLFKKIMVNISYKEMLLSKPNNRLAMRSGNTKGVA